MSKNMILHLPKILLIIVGTRIGWCTSDDYVFLNSAILLCCAYWRDWKKYIIVPSNTEACYGEVTGTKIIAADDIQDLKSIIYSIPSQLDKQSDWLFIHFIGHGSPDGGFCFFDKFMFTDILNQLSNISTRKKIKIFCVLDCCYSGKALCKDDYSKMLVLTACSSDQSAYILEDYTNFTIQYWLWLRTGDNLSIMTTQHINADGRIKRIDPQNNFESSQIYNQLTGSTNGILICIIVLILNYL